ncbi:MAG: hypothetical protein R3B70_13070 [Polyangiaceae bacterium]
MGQIAPEPPLSSEITPEALYSGRREFLKNTALFVGTSAALGEGCGRWRGTGAGRIRRRRWSEVPPLPIGSASAPGAASARW